MRCWLLISVSWQFVWGVLCSSTWETCGRCMDGLQFSGKKIGMAKSAVLFFYYPDSSSGALCTQRWGGYCRKICCSISHKSNKAQPSLILHSPSMIFPAPHEIPSAILSEMTHFCCTLSAPLSVSSLQILFSCYIKKNRWADSKTREGRRI